MKVQVLVKGEDKFAPRKRFEQFTFPEISPSMFTYSVVCFCEGQLIFKVKP